MMDSESQYTKVNVRKPYDGDVNLEARVCVLEVTLDEREKAVRLAVDALESRLALLNELRGEVVSRGELAKTTEVLLTRIESLEKTHSRFVGVAIALVALAGTFGAVVSHLFFKP